MAGREQRMYGFFRCGDCKKQWESSHAYVDRYTKKAIYKQDCKDCKSSWEPYRVERLRCSLCGKQDNCTCNPDDRHVDPNKPHRSDLCQRCRSGRHCSARH